MDPGRGGGSARRAPSMCQSVLEPRSDAPPASEVIPVDAVRIVRRERVGRQRGADGKCATKLSPTDFLQTLSLWAFYRRGPRRQRCESRRCSARERVIERDRCTLRSATQVKRRGWSGEARQGSLARRSPLLAGGFILGSVCRWAIARLYLQQIPLLFCGARTCGKCFLQNVMDARRHTVGDRLESRSAARVRRRRFVPTRIRIGCYVRSCARARRVGTLRTPRSCALTWRGAPCCDVGGPCSVAGG